MGGISVGELLLAERCRLNAVGLWHYKKARGYIPARLDIAGVERHARSCRRINQLMIEGWKPEVTTKCSLTVQIILSHITDDIQYWFRLHYMLCCRWWSSTESCCGERRNRLRRRLWTRRHWSEFIRLRGFVFWQLWQCDVSSSVLVVMQFVLPAKNLTCPHQWFCWATGTWVAAGGKAIRAPMRIKYVDFARA